MLGRPDRPTAIFAANDFEAVGVIEAARQLGLQVPRDVSVVGFDDGVVARSSSPLLTTVRQPLFEMGIAAATALHDLIIGRRPMATQVELATSLVVRDSTMPPA
jgi:DNA-binding LacI/PurR family transcriptional regulator